MRSSYEVRAQKFIRMLDAYLIGCVDAEDYEDASYSFMINHPNRKIRFDHGMTRVAFITSDYVVKIDYDEDNVSLFGGCEDEVRFYEVAEREGMAHLFAKISRYDYNGHTYYIMPKITGINENRWEEAWYYMTREECEWCSNHNLGDLHCKNYGLVNGKVRIIDYGCQCDE